MNKKTFLILLFISLLSLFINLYKKDNVPPCLNTDEAAFGYNAYSLLKTGRDEYGAFLPLRLKSFGDYKMPLYSYLSVPFIAVFGLNEFGVRALNTFVSFLFPAIVFLLAAEIFKKKNIGLLSAFLFSLTPAIQIFSRQAHEAYITVFLIALSLWLLLKSLNFNKSFNLYQFLFLTSLIPLSFGYQFSRLWLGFFFLIIVSLTIRKKESLKFLLVYLLMFFLLSIPDFLINPARVKNLLYFSNIGLGLQTAELRSEGGTRLLYNKATVGLKNMLFNHLEYYSPQFLVGKGDENRRFNYPGISPITAAEYIFFFIGLYFLFKNKEKWRYLLIFLILASPLSASLSWAGAAMNRALPLAIFINLICAYGFYYFINALPKYKKIAVLLLFILYLSFVFYSWDFYFNHYPKRAAVIRAWQCGNKEMALFVKENYGKYDKFYITKKNGQPYIFLLFYLKYNPILYQKQANLSAPDEFGFGQVEKFDKFDFNFQYDPFKKNAVSIGYPDDFGNEKPVGAQEINIGTEKVFWIAK